jgi:hypothetical protein
MPQADWGGGAYGQFRSRAWVRHFEIPRVV